MKRQNVMVLFGGHSSEYSVSLESAHSVIKFMDKSRFNPIMVGISQSGDWFYFSGDIDKILNNTWNNKCDCSSAVLSQNRWENTLYVSKGEEIAKIHIDVIFPVLHGKNGEDGTVQGLVELAGIPLAGCATLSSALCMDKDRAHKLVQLAGIPVPTAFTAISNDPIESIRIKSEKMGLPLYVKPVKAGSSYGVTKVLNLTLLEAAVKLAFEYDSEIIIEKNVDGFEVGCAVMGNQNLITGEVDEIELADGFFDYMEKYSLKTSKIYLPARISHVKLAEIKETAKVIYKVLGCCGFARVDMFFTPSGEIVFNEVNTIPGFTAHSRFPSMMKAVGFTFEQIITMAIELAVSK